MDYLESEGLIIVTNSAGAYETVRIIAEHAYIYSSLHFDSF